MAKKKPTDQTPAKYSVKDYCAILKAAKRSDQTIEGYRKILQSYAKFLEVPLDEVHNHLSVSNLLNYAASREGKSDAGTKTNLSILHRYFKINGVVFDELQYNAVNHKAITEQNDKPLELATLQKMMDLTDPHGRAILSFLISTGCRAGETCNILLSDIDGDVVTIRNEIAKGGHGGKVYLTAEAREYLDLWLKVRDEYVEIVDARSKGLITKGITRPKHDDRVFVNSYPSMHRIFSRLYEKVDGEQGKYHAKCTIHSCRKYFRTHAAKTMHPDLVTGLMRQTGYLDSTYIRMTDEEKRAQFHAGEHALYITRADHRIQGSKLDALARENKELREMVQAMQTLDKISLSEADRTAIAEKLFALQNERKKK